MTLSGPKSEGAMAAQRIGETIAPPRARAAGRSRVRGLVLAAISAIAFGSAGVCGKAAMAASEGLLSPVRLAQIRITGAALVLLFIVTISRRTKTGRALPRIVWTRQLLGVVMAYGLLAFVGVQVLYFIAISRMPVGIALLIEYLGPALVALYALVVQRRPQHGGTWFGILTALLGLTLIARPWSGFTLDAIGVTAALGAAVALAVYFLVAESVGDRLPALPLSAYAAGVAAIAMAVVAPWWSFPFSVLGRTAGLLGVQVPIWVLVLIVILIGTVLAYVTGLAALAHLPAPVASVVATLEVVVASLTAWILLGEHLSPLEIAGGGLLLLGAILAQRRN
jgi:drug/metabolite transporter (DMT)-like permease